jgi:hypothetical protein
MGPSDFAKFQFLSDTSKEQNLDFIALLETGKNYFSQSTLDNLSAGKISYGTGHNHMAGQGGILLGVNLDSIDIGSIDEGDFYVKFRVRNKCDGFWWVLVAVYGAAQPVHKKDFVTELVHTCSKENLPIVIGGDFI